MQTILVPKDSCPSLFALSILLHLLFKIMSLGFDPNLEPKSVLFQCSEQSCWFQRFDCETKRHHQQYGQSCLLMLEQDALIQLKSASMDSLRYFHLAACFRVATSGWS